MKQASVTTTPIQSNDNVLKVDNPTLVKGNMVATSAQYAISKNQPNSSILVAQLSGKNVIQNAKYHNFESSPPPGRQMKYF